jgi:putative FmdB family regulatory protein
VPTYQYHCQDCTADLEIFQKMTDPTLTVCPRCEGHLRKVFVPVGVVFKGSGFYATDSRSSHSTLPAADKAEAKTETKAEAKAESTPKVETKAATPAKEPALAA